MYHSSHCAWCDILSKSVLIKVKLRILYLAWYSLQVLDETKGALCPQHTFYWTWACNITCTWKNLKENQKYVSSGWLHSNARCMLSPRRLVWKTGCNALIGVCVCVYTSVYAIHTSIYVQIKYEHFSQIFFKTWRLLSTGDYDMKNAELTHFFSSTFTVLFLWVFYKWTRITEFESVDLKEEVGDVTERRNYTQWSKGKVCALQTEDCIFK